MISIKASQIFRGTCSLRHSFRSLSSHRPFTTSHRAASVFSSQPSPPRLPKEEQDIFEKLVRDNEPAGAFAAPRSSPEEPEPAAKTENELRTVEASRARIAAKGDGEELHPHVRRGAKPEFQGDINPKTGEVGGPKNEPLRWGQAGDWSYNGRVTDF